MLQGKCMAITGGTRGLGAATAVRAADAGADVAIIGRDAKAAESVLADIRARGRSGSFVAADFLQPEAAGGAIDRAADQLGGLDILVNNAAIALRRDLQSATLDDWHQMLDVNLLAPFFAARAAAERFADHGVIINVASEMGQLANPQSILYGVTKAALLHLNSGLALALADRSIRVVAVAPGPIRTAMLEESVRQAGLPLDQGLAGYAERLPLKRLAEPDEIADTVIFLASDKATFITGAVVNLDGGSTIPRG